MAASIACRPRTRPACVKTVTAQMLALLATRPARRNIRMLFRFVLVLMLLVTAYAAVFHLLMLREEEFYIPRFFIGLFATLCTLEAEADYRPVASRLIELADSAIFKQKIAQ